MVRNGLNKVEQSWNRVGNIWIDHSDNFTTPLMTNFGPQGVQTWFKMGLYSYYWVQMVSGDHKWLEQGGSRLEQDRGH